MMAHKFMFEIMVFSIFLSFYIILFPTIFKSVTSSFSNLIAIQVYLNNNRASGYFPGK
jgi:hypothetical protein